MILTREIADVRSAVAAAHARNQQVGFVPTMGFLHEGHLSLIDMARRSGAGYVVVSIFVNPTQFGPGEDFGNYPRDEARDVELLRSRGTDLIFTPTVETMYPPGAMTRVSVGAVAAPLEGERRTGHFEGVATIVAKLFNIVQPDIAVFGQKDAQQCAVIRQLVRDLDVPVTLVFAETRREADGLAMSSRNSYLTAEQRKLAPALYEALQAGHKAILNGGGSVEHIERQMQESLAGTPGVQADYLRLVDPNTFRAPEDLHRDLLLVGALRVGTTRLIDNIPVPVKGRSA